MLLSSFRNKTIFQIASQLVHIILILFLSACGDDIVNSTNKSSLPSPSLEFVAGELGGRGNADGLVGRFSYPVGIAVNDAGTIYVSDSDRGWIRTINSEGVVSTILNNATNRYFFEIPFNGNGSYRSALALDQSGNLYVAGDKNCQIRLITPSGESNIYAGFTGCGYQDGNLQFAQFGRISSIAIDSFGALYVVDQDNFVIRKISPTGEVCTLAGQALTPGQQDGMKSDARFHSPQNIAVDLNGTVYVSDTNGRKIRKITPDGLVTNLTPQWDRSVRLKEFRNVAGMVTDKVGNLYIVNEITIVKITPNGHASELAGGQEGIYIGSLDGQGKNAQFGGRASSYGNDGGGVSFWTNGMLSIDKNGNLYFADTFSTSIRKITPDGWVSTIAGKAEREIIKPVDGSGATARFVYIPSSDNNWLETERQNKLSTDVDGNLYVKGMGYASEAGAERKVNIKGEVSTTFFDYHGFSDRMIKDGMVYTIGSTTISKRKLGQYEQEHLAGNRRIHSDTDFDEPKDGKGSEAAFFNIMASNFDRTGNIYVIDRDKVRAPLFPPPWKNHKIPGDKDEGGLIRKITPDGVVTTLAGSLEEHGYADGIGKDARFHIPSSLAINAEGNIFVADTLNHTIRKITPTGLVSTFAGTATVSGFSDGVGRKARFNSPNIVVFDRRGNLYIADSGNFLVRKITPAGEVSTVAGTRGSRGVVPGKLPASLSFISGMTISDDDVLYIFSENAVLKIALNSKH